jgi:predicted nucleic acid-binding protein
MEPEQTRAVLDANVLYPAAVRDVLLYLARMKLYQPRWSERIQQEWMRNLLRNRPDLAPDRLERTRALMEKAVPDALVSGHEHHIERLELPDPDDRHVLAVAIHAGAAMIVTFNGRDFPESAVGPYGIGIVTPDQFVLGLLAGDSQTVLATIRRQHSELQRNRPPLREHLRNLGRVGFPRSAAELDRILDQAE